MNETTILLVIAFYFGILLIISHFIGKKNSGNSAFFLGNRKSPWLVVAFGAIGSSLSGVSFVSVPGMVRSFDMTYMQMVFGFLLGYAVITFVLLPLYYKLQLVSIYTYLEQRIGRRAYKTGASFFLLSRTVGAATRMYVAILVLQTYIFDKWHIPFELTTIVFLLLIWLYTHRGGVMTIVWTDLLQTFFLLAALCIIIFQVAKGMNLDFGQALASIKESPHSRIFVFDDWHSRQNFFKQLLSGMFITIAMTGVDQEMMQKNLSCRSLKESQKNVFTSSLFFIPVNFLFLGLGILLLNYAGMFGITLPESNDSILPLMVSNGYFGNLAVLFFAIGIIAVTFASVDSAITGLTTSIYIDILEIDKLPEKQNKKVRDRIHLGISVVFIFIILILKEMNSNSLIDTFYTIISYTYGPLLGLFGFGILFKKRQTNDKAVPWICVAAPVFCFALSKMLNTIAAYQFGYEILILNSLLVMAGLFFFKKKDNFCHSKTNT